MTTDDELEIVLDPIDASSLRAANGTAVWETVRGRRNRITVGTPRWQPVDADPGVRARFPADRFGVTQLELSLTLLPDKGCRFRSADLILSLTDAVAQFVDLNPRSTSSSVDHTRTRPQASAGVEVPGVGDVRLASGNAIVQYTQVVSTLEAFGLDSPEAGWRLSMARGQEIPLTTSGLVATIVYPRGTPGSVALNVVAEIDVNTAVDRWLTWAFQRNAPTAELIVEMP